MDQTSILTTIEVTESNSGLTDRIYFEVPKGSLKKSHIEAYLNFLTQNSMPKIIKSLTSIYFTADADVNRKMSDAEKLFMERSLILLAEHADTGLYKPLKPVAV